MDIHGFSWSDLYYIFFCSPQKINYKIEPLFSNENSNFVKSVSAIGLIFHHYSQIMPTFMYIDELVRDVSSAIGFIFSAIFLFTSGYGLEKKKEFSGVDICNRMIRITVPYFLLGLIVCSLNYERNAIKKIFTFFMINNGEILDGKWFIVAILYFNIMFMLIKIIFKNSRLELFLNFLILFTWIGVGLLINVGQWWYNTSASFLCGVLIARNEGNWKNILINKKYYYWISIVVLSMIFLVSTYMGGFKKYWLGIEIASISGAIIVYELCNKRDVKSNFLTKCIATNTLELYMIQSVLLEFLYEKRFCRTGAAVLGIVIFVILIGYILGSINMIIIKYLLKRNGVKK